MIEIASEKKTEQQTKSAAHVHECDAWERRDSQIAFSRERSLPRWVRFGHASSKRSFDASFRWKNNKNKYRSSTVTAPVGLTGVDGRRGENVQRWASRLTGETQ